MVLQSVVLAKRCSGHAENTLSAGHIPVANSGQVAPNLEAQASHMVVVLQELVCKSFAGGQMDTMHR